MEVSELNRSSNCTVVTRISTSSTILHSTLQQSTVLRSDSISQETSHSARVERRGRGRRTAGSCVEKSYGIAGVHQGYTVCSLQSAFHSGPTRCEAQIFLLLTYASALVQSFYSPARYTLITTQFRETFLRLHDLPSVPLLHLALQAGLASLKTGVCLSGGGKDISFSIAEGGASVSEKQEISKAARGLQYHGLRSPNCPVCSSPLITLAREVPFSHYINSSIVCPLSGGLVVGSGGEEADAKGEGGDGLMAIVRTEEVDGKQEQVGRVYSKSVSPEIVALTFGCCTDLVYTVCLYFPYPPTFFDTDSL